MVYCTECGNENEEDAKFCVNCGVSLYFEEKEDECFGWEKRVEDECFGLPHGGAIMGIIFGTIIVLGGLSLLLSNVLDWRWIGSFMVIAVGVLIIAGAIYGFTRRKK